MSRLAALLALACIAEVASAQSDTPWNGFYVGANTGGARNNTCMSSMLKASANDSASAAISSGCPGGGLVGGLQIGENFQTKRLVWGVGADVDFWSAKDNSSSLKSTGAALPPGTYTLSSKPNPNDFAIVGGRIGYAGNLWLPFLKAGALITTGSHNSTVSYTPAGTTKPTAAFDGGKDLSSTGWVAGGGTEIGLNGAWSISVEYLHANLGKGANSTTACSGSASACAGLSGVSLDTSRHGSGVSLFRIGLNYWFGYWEP
jgi:outer membrane immunogenic protein